MSKQQELSDGLRQLADFLDSVPLTVDGGVTINLFADSNKEFAENVRMLGNAEKHACGDWFFVTKRFGPHVKLELNRPREAVCRKVVKGQRVIPAKPAEPERVEDIMEWECPDSVLLLLNESPSAPAR